jgi:glycerophosphoryl diester phosphodiesterase
MAAFEYALAAGCDGFEFDVRHTRDNQNVLWHDPEWQGLPIDSTNATVLADKDGTRLALLEDVLREFSHRAYLDIELKAPGNEGSVVAALKENPPQRGFLVSSFYPEILTRLRALDPGLPLGFIFDRRDAMAIWREMPVQVLLPQQDFINPVLIDEAHYRGLQIMTWTVNHRADMLRIADLLIDGLISDDPQVLYQTFQSR